MRGLFTLPPLPYGLDVLEPFMSEGSLQTHYKSYHQEYVNMANMFVIDTDLRKFPIEYIIRQSYQTHPELHYYASQHYNHTLFWRCMRKYGESKDNEISDQFKKLIEVGYGSMSGLKKAFIDEANSVVGSGWIFLVIYLEGNGGSCLKIIKCADGETPLIKGYNYYPILALDLWEHSYYGDYFQDREDYVNNFWEHVIDWIYVSGMYGYYVPWEFM